MRPLLLLALAGAASAQGPTETCVEVATERADARALRRLVVDELDRHPTHRGVEAPKDRSACGSYLRVEVIELAEGRWLTGRINDQVPHRERVHDDDLTGALSRLLTVVLHNDPVRLRGPRRGDWVRDSLRDLKRGRTLWGVEAYQVGGWLDGGVAALPGLALNLRREVDAWHLGVRLGYAGRPGAAPEDLALNHHVAAQLQVIWFADALGDASFYGGALIGAEHQRFSGPAPGYGDGASDTASATGLAVGGRLGVELFRTTTGRFDLFAQVALPAFVANDEDAAGVVDAWLPTVTVGAGMLF